MFGELIDMVNKINAIQLIDGIGLIYNKVIKWN